jgi:putative transposase
LITAEFEQRLYNVIAAKSKSLGAVVYAVGGMNDHIHLAASVPPKAALAQFIGQVKGNSSHFVNHELALPYHFGWQAEYGIVSFGEKQLNWIVNYVKNQPQHHSEKRNVPFLERVTGE